VLEVSSFQLERAPEFHPRVSILLNVTEDHLDRYSSFVAYAEAKGNAFVNQVRGDVSLVPFGDAICEEQAMRGEGDLWTFGRATTPFATAWLRSGGAGKSSSSARRAPRPPQSRKRRAAIGAAGRST
jgi:UDP-N-acetylmuramoylalanine-D-glutamate ligase